jgi:hypothetical protein
MSSSLGPGVFKNDNGAPEQIRSAPLVERQVVARVVTQVNLPRPGDFLLGIEQHFFPLRDPSRSAGNSEQDREHGRGEAHRLVDQPGVEIHVGVQLALHEVIVFEGDALAFERDLQQRILAHQIEDVVRHFLDDAGARIVVLVDAVPEPHQLGFTGLYTLDELGNPLYRANFHQHAHDFFVGAAVQRAVERGDGRGGGGVGIDVGAADAADGVRRAVLLVVGVQDKQDVQCMFEGGIAR